jgi:transcriptional regulator with XRE-family HTH domain
LATPVNPKVATLVTDSSQGVGHDAEMRHHLMAWRKYRGLSQEQLGKAMGTGKSNVSKIEKGHRQFKDIYKEKAARALNCEIGQLFAPPPKGQEINTSATSATHNSVRRGDDNGAEGNQAMDSVARSMIRALVEQYGLDVVIKEAAKADDALKAKTRPQMRG